MRGGPPVAILHQARIKPLSRLKIFGALRYNAAPNSERWMSGLSHHPGKVAYAQVYRGFESLSLRQVFLLLKLFKSPQYS